MSLTDRLKRWSDRLNRAIAGPPAAAASPMFGAGASGAATQVRDNIRGPIRGGLIVILIFVVGIGLWASFAPIWSAVVAPASVQVEASRKTVRTRDGGVVREILVREGQSVNAGDLLLRFDDTVPQAQFDVLSQQYDNTVMQQARFLAEVNGARTVTVPAELSARLSDPRVSQVVNNELLIFNSRLATLDNQSAILNQRFEQLNTARGGLDVQVRSIDEQVDLITEELDGYRRLNEQGYAPRTLILRYERQLAEIAGRRGALVSEITRNTQQAGEVRLQLTQLREQRETEAAAGLRDAEARIADIGPRLNAARDALAQTRVTAPDTGFVLNLTQFTIGGVAGAGEVLMDVVPANAPLIVRAQIQPQDIDEVRAGMVAQVQLSAYSAQRVPKVEGRVVTVSADAISNDQGQRYYQADLRIEPTELAKLPEGVDLYPGMPAQAMIRTGRRTIMAYLIGPLGDMINRSLREQ